MKLIKRQDYLDKLTGALGTPDIKVITGVRRCGKSKLLEAFKEYVTENVAGANVIHINFSLLEYADLLHYKDLYRYISGKYRAGAQNFVLIDEVQMCSGFERALNSLHAEEKYDIYVTGSNAFLLSSDLATLFTGRTFEVKVFPFSFAEYMRYFELTDINSAFDGYIREGGMAGSYLYKDEQAKYDYIAEVFNTLILRDIVSKYELRNTALLDKVTDFLMDNIANLSSPHSIAKALSDERERENNVTISAYVKYLCNAFAFYRVRRYDIRGKKYLQSSDKYYLSDHSFRYAKLGTRNMDVGRTEENMVAVELLRRGWEVYAGVLYQKEVDFVALRRNEKIYIQVADDIGAPETLQRELAPLLSIKDAYPKMILTRTCRETCDREGVVIKNLAQWLKG